MASVDMCEHDWPGSGCRECFPLPPASMPTPAEPGAAPTTRWQAIRQANALTQEQLATMLAVSLRTIKRWEAGDPEPHGAALVIYRLLERDELPSWCFPRFAA